MATFSEQKCVHTQKYSVLYGDKEPRIVHLFNESSLKPILVNKTNKPIHKYITDLYSTGSSQYKGEELYDEIRLVIRWRQ